MGLTEILLLHGLHDERPHPDCISQQFAPHTLPTAHLYERPVRLRHGPLHSGPVLLSVRLLWIWAGKPLRVDVTWHREFGIRARSYPTRLTSSAVILWRILSATLWGLHSCHYQCILRSYSQRALFAWELCERPEQHRLRE